MIARTHHPHASSRTSSRDRRSAPALALAAAAALALLAAAPRPAAAEERVLRLEPAGSEVTFVVEATGHDVHGSLALRGGEIRFDPETGAASGTIEIDAKSAETGNGSRDKTMHGDVLESAKYPLFVFHAKRFDGDLALGGSSDIELAGDLEIHGASHPLKIPAKVDIDGDRLSTHATFPIPYVDWGMERPGMMFLKVAPVVQVTVEAEGSLGAATRAETAKRTEESKRSAGGR